MNWKKTLLICFLILLCGAAVTAVIFFTEPTAQRTGATRETAMLVDVVRVQRDTFRPTIVALGTVEPEREVVLSPLVGGELIERAPAFTPGGDVRKGTRLLRIDPEDYRNALRQRKSELNRAIADLEIEKGLQEVARQDYQLLGEELTGEDKGLVLREPQLNTARAQVAAARAAVDQAELELRRTAIKAPFDAHILSREVDVGSQVAPGDRLGRLVGLETYWVVATVPLGKLNRIAFPDAAGGRGAAVRIRHPGVWPEGAWRRGYVTSLVGALEEQTRMARVLVSVPDPLAVRPGHRDRPALVIGAFVEASIQAEEIADVVRLDRDYLRQDDTVWVMEEDKLRIRQVEVVFRDARYAYIAEGLQEGEQVVTTNLATVTDGARLRLEGSGGVSERESQSGKTQSDRGGAG